MINHRLPLADEGIVRLLSHRTWLTAAACAFAASLAAPSASAGVAATPVLPPCEGQTLVRPFLPWLDPAYYVLAPDGGFEQFRTRWTLASGATIVRGNEPFFVRSRSDLRSLSLPAGSSATSAPMCVGLGHPTLRFFARNEGSSLGALRVDVLYRDLAGRIRSLEVARVTGTSTWRPTAPIAFLVNVTAPLSANGRTAVAFRFRPVGTASAWRIDDVYVDPYKMK